jgi:dTDP-4-dehydrorhamnose reductase
MRILVTGGNGLLARALHDAAPAGIEMSLLSHCEFDLTQVELMDRQLAAFRPQIVINTAAYNAVDRCEVERELSWAVNATGPLRLAERCAKHRCRLIHYSTDYVFDGAKKSPYVETDPPNPLNYYAAGKLAGEQSVLKAEADNLVLRTSWLFGDNGEMSRSYVHTVLRQLRTGSLLKAATDQIAAPTYAPDLARWTLELLEKGSTGLVHAVNDDPLSRHEWTVAIVAEAEQEGLIRSRVAVDAVRTDFFGAGIRRPGYTVLSNAKAAAILRQPLDSWRPGLRQLLRQITAEETVNRRASGEPGRAL